MSDTTLDGLCQLYSGKRALRLKELKAMNNNNNNNNNNNKKQESFIWPRKNAPSSP